MSCCALLWKRPFYWKGGSYIRWPCGPSRLDELLSSFIWFSVFGPCKPVHLEIMTHSESVHLCAEFNKLIYQPCSRSRAAKGFLRQRWALVKLCLTELFWAIYYSIILDHVAMECTTLLLYLLSSTWTHPCNFPHTSGRITVCQRLVKLGLWSTSQLDPMEWSLHPEIRVVCPLIAF